MVALQLSVAVTPLNTLGTATWQLPSAPALVGAGQLTVGATRSWTETMAVQVALLPLLSVTVKVTRLVPILVQSKLVLSRLRLAMPQASELPLLTWAGVIVTWPVDVWFNESRTFDAVLDFGTRQIAKITLDPGGRFPDRDTSDNVWPRR